MPTTHSKPRKRSTSDAKLDILLVYLKKYVHRYATEKEYRCQIPGCSKIWPDGNAGYKTTNVTLFNHLSFPFLTKLSLILKKIHKNIENSYGKT